MSDDEIDMTFDDFDVEVKKESDEEVHGGDEVEEETPETEEMLSDEGVKHKNSLFTGLYDPVKYRVLENKKIKERMVIPAENRRTSHRLTLAEKTNLIGVRAAHIEKGAPIFVEIHNLNKPEEIAEKELRERRFPFLLERKINRYEVEYWDPNEMTIEW